MAHPFLVRLPAIAAAAALASAASAKETRLGSTCPKCGADGVVQTASEPEAAVRRSGEEALPPDYTRVTADDLRGQTAVGVEAQGDVIVERNQQVLNAEKVSYDQKTDTVRAGGGFILDDSGSTVRGDKLQYNLTAGSGKAEDVAMEAERDGRRLQAVGKQAELENKNRYTLTDVEFNTCQKGDASWYISAQSIEADYEKGVGVAKHAKLVFKGVPVLYTPWADFPLNGNRKSGLLVPTLKVGSNGTEIEAPYYFNLAPNYDATLTPGIISARGVQLGGQFRYLQPKYEGEVSGKWMPDDRRSRHNNRYTAFWRHSHNFGGGLSGKIDFNQVSDNDYYRDFYDRADIARNVNLNREARLDYQTDVLGEWLEAHLKVQKYQTLANADGYKDEPYAILPRLSANWQKNFAGNLFTVGGQYTRFTHSSKQSGQRFVLYPALSRDFHNNWGYIRPKIGLHYTRYLLNSFEGRPGRTASRSLPIANIDAGMTFERETSLFGRNRIQTLEPRLFYNYIPTKSQNDLPNFDTAENSFSYGQLFRENLYSGQDRINSANSLTAALQTRYLDRDSGAERLRAGIGQKFYFKNDNVLLDGSVRQNKRTRSDWIAFADGEISRSVNAYTVVHFNENQSRFENIAAGIRYRPEDGKTLSLRYRYGRDKAIYLQDNGLYLRDKINQIDLGAQWPITANLYGLARYNHALDIGRPLDILAGLEYKDACGCWSVSAAAQRYVTGWNTERDKPNYKNAFFFTLQLKSLSNIGNKADETLRPAIPGYIKTNEVVK